MPDRSSVEPPDWLIEDIEVSMGEARLGLGADARESQRAAREWVMAAVRATQHEGGPEREPEAEGEYRRGPFGR